MNRESRIWRRLAIAGAAAVGVLAGRLVMIRFGEDRSPFKIVHDLYADRVGEPGEPVDEEDLFTETHAQQFERRLAAVEEHLQHLPPERM